MWDYTIVLRPDSSRGRESGKQSHFSWFSDSKKMGVAEMGVVMMLKLAGNYLYSRTDVVRFERFSVLKITY